MKAEGIKHLADAFTTKARMQRQQYRNVIPRSPFYKWNRVESRKGERHPKKGGKGRYEVNNGLRLLTASNLECCAENKAASCKAFPRASFTGLSAVELRPSWGRGARRIDEPITPVKPTGLAGFWSCCLCPLHSASTVMRALRLELCWGKHSHAKKKKSQWQFFFPPCQFVLRDFFSPVPRQGDIRIGWKGELCCVHTKSVSLPVWLFVAFRVILALKGAGLISVALLRGNGYHFRYSPRKN